MLDRFQIIIKLIDKRHSSGDLQPSDFLIGYIIQDLDQGLQGKCRLTVGLGGQRGGGEVEHSTSTKSYEQSVPCTGLSLTCQLDVYCCHSTCKLYLYSVLQTVGV